MNTEVTIKSLYGKGKPPLDEYKNCIYSIYSAERCYVQPGERKLINTFLEIQIPDNFFGLITTRKEAYIKNGLYAFQEILLPQEKKELLLMVTNVNIPKSPYMMSDNERFLGQRSKIDVHVGDKIANIILIPTNPFIFKQLL